MFNFFSGLALIGAVFYIAMIYNSPAIALLGVVLGVFFVLSFVWLLVLQTKLQIRLRIPVAVSEQKKKTAVEVLVENKGGAVCPKLKLRLKVKNRLEKRFRAKWLAAGAADRRENRYVYQLFLERSGSYEVSLGKVRIYDLTGLFSIGRREKSSAGLTVLPEITETMVRLTAAARNFFGETDTYDSRFPGHDSSEMFGVRPFCDGDKIQRIHWKLSAKLDEWMVKEDSLPRACPVVIFLEYQEWKKGRNLEILLRLAGSLSFSLMDAGCPHFVSWFSRESGDIVRFRVDKEEEFYLFLTFLMEDLQKTQEGGAEARYREKFPGERYIYGLRLDDRLCVYRNGEMFVRFSSNKWEKQLQNTEWIF